jgi:2-hydroxychromene-2-carboxylate isomerase
MRRRGSDRLEAPRHPPAVHRAFPLAGVRTRRTRMAKIVDYYFAVVSPWSYLGHDRFVALAARQGATVGVKPVDLAKIFPVSGGLPLAKRAPQRQAYRLIELARWREFLGIPLNLKPKFGATGGDLATRWILALAESGVEPAMRLAGAVMRARWAEERDVADEATLAAIAGELGQDGSVLAARAATPEIQARYEACTQEAIDRQLFGVPTYVYRDEPFWGQDRLDFLGRKLAE